MKSLSIKNLNWSYDEKKILDEITVDIKSSLFTGIIGPNGSGKTTLAKLLSKLLPVDKKIIYLEKMDLSQIRIKELAKTMALVPQSNTVTYDLTVFEVVLLGRTPHLRRFEQEKKEDFELVKSVMIETDTWQYKDRLIHQLSGGERQRVVIARALAQEPEVLILDEPVTYLDVHHQLQVMALIKSLSEKRKITVLVILHDLNHALKYCDQVIMLNEGRIFKYGSPINVVTQDNIKEIYDIEVHMIEHPITKQRIVIF